MELVFHRIRALKAAGLEGSHVVYNFFSSHITPLRLCPKLSCLYTDPTDPDRTLRKRGSELRDGMLWGTFRLSLGRDMPPTVVFPAEAGPLHHRSGKFAIICEMPKLGCLEPLAPLEPQEGEAAPSEAYGPTPRERSALPSSAAGRFKEPESTADPKGKGKAPTPPLSWDSSDDDRWCGVKQSRG